MKSFRSCTLAPRSTSLAARAFGDAGQSGTAWGSLVPLAQVRRGTRVRLGTSTSHRPYDLLFSATDQSEGRERPPHDAADPSEAVEDDPRLAQMRLEAVLLLAKGPLSPRKLAQLAHLADATAARTLVRQLNRTYDQWGRALRVEQVAGGFRLLTRPSLSPWLARLGHLPPPVRLSTPMMETLAVVAYRQPVSRAAAEAVRGVACGELLRQLMERELIRIVGRSEELGRPYLYGTTKRFLQLFGLPNVDALPPITWETLQEDSNPDDTTPDELSTSTKEPVVTTTVAPDLAEAELPRAEVVADAAHAAPAGPQVTEPAAALDEDEDDPFFDDDDDDDDDDDEDWDEDDDWDDDDLDEDDDDDDLEEDNWEEVDDIDADEDDDEEDDDWDEEDEDWDDELVEDEDDEDEWD